MVHFIGIWLFLIVVMIISTSVLSVVTSPSSFIIDLSLLFFVMSLVNDFSILFIFSKTFLIVYRSLLVFPSFLFSLMSAVIFIISFLLLTFEVFWLFFV